MSSQQNNSNDWASWIPIVVLFCIPYTWPIALILLLRKLTGADKKKRAPRHPYDIQREQQRAGQQQPSAAGSAQAASGGAPTAGQKTSAQKSPGPQPSEPRPAGQKTVRRSVRSWFSKGTGLTVAGAVISGVFALGFLSELAEAISWGGISYMISDLVALLGFLCLGLVLLFCGLARTRRGKRCRKYLSLIGKRSSVSIDALARTTGTRRRKVLDDLQDMLDDGLLPTGYLDLAHDRLVLSEEGIPDEAPPEKPPAAEPQAPQDDNAILQEIRAVNDAIPDPVLSAKIDRIGEITGRILEYQRSHPDKDSQLRSFLNYYLPTTLKILHAYAQLDAQGVEGENISTTKARIEGMMDKVVEGFETQLDRLFRDSAMDISSDVAVLEQMLEKDGLSGQGLTLGK